MQNGGVLQVNITIVVQVTARSPELVHYKSGGRGAADIFCVENAVAV